MEMAMFRDFGPISPSEPNNTALRLGNCVNRTSHALKITGQALYVIFSPQGRLFSSGHESDSDLECEGMLVVDELL
jgi:hypothetical protein